ncbi:unnamed protein product [Closterium sp. NIES-54]
MQTVGLHQQPPGARGRPQLPSSYPLVFGPLLLTRAVSCCRRASLVDRCSLVRSTDCSVDLPVELPLLVDGPPVAQIIQLQLSSSLVDSNTTVVPCSSTKPVEQLSCYERLAATPVHPTKSSALPKRGRGQHSIPVNILATVVTDPSVESTAASALVAELVDFAAACLLDYATTLVTGRRNLSVLQLLYLISWPCYLHLRETRMHQTPGPRALTQRFREADDYEGRAAQLAGQGGGQQGRAAWRPAGRRTGKEGRRSSQQCGAQVGQGGAAASRAASGQGRATRRPAGRRNGQGRGARYKQGGASSRAGQRAASWAAQQAGQGRSRLARRRDGQGRAALGQQGGATSRAGHRAASRAAQWAGQRAASRAARWAGQRD